MVSQLKSQREGESCTQTFGPVIYVWLRKGRLSRTKGWSCCYHPVSPSGRDSLVASGPLLSSVSQTSRVKQPAHGPFLPSRLESCQVSCFGKCPVLSLLPLDPPTPTPQLGSSQISYMQGAFPGVLTLPLKAIN